MRHLATRAQLRRAILDPTLDLHLRALLRLRFEQLGGTGADFHVVQPGDTLVSAEEAVGWTMTYEGQPCFEWIRLHPGGIAEVTFVLSDDGPAQVLIVPDTADASILDVIRAHA